ncbi:MAG TPA: phosphatase PAP2 family protein [Anaerolineales bacterium]|jgi:membrane-associated phospholipid phosphatase|nr:phosphatase PAP2 family protein [Anaerolineales bacterium]
MDTLIENGVDWILALQSLGSWLELPMRFFTALGNENFFFLVLPLLYWSVDAGLGLRVAFILATSNYLNSIIKLLFAGPRPFWVSAQVEPLLHEDTFGIPSGHAQNAAAFIGIAAAWINKSWAWAAALLLAFFIGISRLYLGLHFVQDVLAGWAIGYGLLFLFIGAWRPVTAWLRTKTLPQQIGLSLLISLIMLFLGILAAARLDGYVFPAAWADNALRAGPVPDPVSVEGTFTSAGSFFGLAAGAAWIASRGGFQTEGPIEKRALRYVIGLLGIVLLWFGLGQIFPDGETVVPLILRYVRYSLVGFWVTAGAPWLFFHFNLVRQPKM